MNNVYQNLTDYYNHVSSGIIIHGYLCSYMIL